MTTAARPTFEPARGGRGKGEGDLSALSKQYSSRDLPGHTKIKYRQPTQDAPEEVRARDFRRELEERERVAAREKTRERGPRDGTTMLCSRTVLKEWTRPGRRNALSMTHCALSSTRNLWRSMLSKGLLFVYLNFFFLT
uniref:Spliceosome-associated protein CWC15 homolog n=1 Tax=Amphiprion ocellaris TaxID=80972 RepID=A0AAQ5YH91_AMPOC